MVGNDKVAAERRPKPLTFSNTSAGKAWSLASTASPPSNCLASRCKPASMRLAKNPTDDSAATPRLTATNNRRNSPARASRHSALPTMRSNFKVMRSSGRPSRVRPVPNHGGRVLSACRGQCSKRARVQSAVVGCAIRGPAGFLGFRCRAIGQ